jgi:hypothetical protein
MHFHGYNLIITAALACLVLDASALKAEPLLTTINKIELLQLTSAATPEKQIEFIPEWLAQKFNLRPDCDSRWFVGISENQCLLGLKRLAWGWLEQGHGRLPAGILIHLGNSGTYQPLNNENRVAEMSLAYDLAAHAFAAMINAAIAAPEYRQRLEFLERLESLTQALEQKLGAEIEIAEDIPNLAALSALVQLSSLLAEDPPLAPAQTEVFRIAGSFAPPYEENLKLKESLAVHARLDELRAYLAKPERTTRFWRHDREWPRSFFQARTDLEQSKHKLEGLIRIKEVTCSPMGSLTQAGCLKALEKLERLVEANSVHLPERDMLMIMSKSETPQKEYAFRDKASGISLLQLREDFTLGGLAHFLSVHNWPEEIKELQ